MGLGLEGGCAPPSQKMFFYFSSEKCGVLIFVAKKNQPMAKNRDPRGLIDLLGAEFVKCMGLGG